MNQDINIYNQSTSEVDGKYLQASQQLQIDKQTYGSDYIHLYVEDREGDWLENLDWEDDLTDYVDAFYHHCEQHNYQFAFDALIAGDELFKQPVNHQKCLELYGYLAKCIEIKSSEPEKQKNEAILDIAKQRILVLRNTELVKNKNMPEKIHFNQIKEPEGNRLGYMKKLLDKVHNGVIRKTWKFEVSTCEYEPEIYYSKEGTANSGDILVKFGIWYDHLNGGYFLSIKNGAEAKEDIVNEDAYSSTYSIEERDLILGFLQKVDSAKWQAKSVDLDALPE